MNRTVSIRSRGESTGSLVRQRDLGGLLVMELVHPPGLVVEAHSHENPYLCFVLEGAYEDAQQSDSKIRAAGSLFVQPPMVTHSNRIHPGGARDLAIEFDKTWLPRLGTSAQVLEKPVLIARGAAIRNALQIHAELHLDDAASSLAVQGLTLELIAALERTQATESRPPQWLKAAMEFLNDCCGTRLDLIGVAKHVGVHPVHLARTFRRHVGCSIGEYLRKARVDAACQALRRSDHPIAAIAMQLGFYDQSHFNRVFKRVTAMTPREYRSLHRLR